MVTEYMFTMKKALGLIASVAKNERKKERERGREGGRRKGREEGKEEVCVCVILHKGKTVTLFYSVICPAARTLSLCVINGQRSFFHL